MSSQATRETETDAGCRTAELDRFERNRFFYGKLMTARDMQAEQDYHADRLQTLARLVSGEGVVCGLEAAVEETEVDDEARLAVTIQPGFALDSCGRPVVVKNAATKYLDLPGTDDIYLHLSYSECSKETVPIPGSEDACEEECTYNRVLEIFDVDYVEISGETSVEDVKSYKAVSGIEFPTKGDVDADLEAALAAVARSYYEDETGELIACGIGSDPRVFLGAFQRNGGSWGRLDEPSRPHVYTNDMLYAAIARHVTRFDDPHDVTAEQTGALVSVEGVENPGGGVDLESPDGTLSIGSDDPANRIDLDVSESFRDELEARLQDLQNQLDDHSETLQDHDGRLDSHGETLDEHGEAIESLDRRVRPLERYVRDKTIKYKITAFSGVAVRFESEIAGEIAARSRDAVDERVYEDDESYLEFIEEVFEPERELIEEVADAATEDSLERYERAIAELEEAFERGREDVLQVAVAQDQVCEAAEWLEHRERPTERPEIPVDIPDEVFVPRIPTFDPTRFDDIRVQPTQPTGPEPRPDPTELPIDPTGTTVDVLREEIGTIDDPRVLEAIRDAELAGENRTTAIEAIDRRIETVSEPTTQPTETTQPTGTTPSLDPARTTLDTAELTVEPAEITIDPTTMTVSTLESEIGNVNDVEELRTMYAVEESGPNRTTARETIESRIRDLGGIL